MKKQAIAVAALGLVFALAPSDVDAQRRWAFELRANAAVPTQDIGDDELDTGFGLEGTFRYRFLTHLGAYAGWDWIRFGADDAFAGANMDLEETGYVLGLRFEHPFSGEEPTGAGLAWWVRAGGTYNHIEVENSDGDMVADSGHGVGWEAGGGLAYGFAGSWSLTPGVRYRSLSRDVEIGGTTTDVDLQYVAFEVGLARFF